MTTQQTERDMFIELFPLAIDTATGNMKVAYMVAFDAFKAARAPLLSRIAELEKKLNFFDSVDAATIQKLEETVSQQQSRIDALSKDAEWQPIKTAPRDGTKFYGFNQFGVKRDVMWNDVLQDFDVNGHSSHARGYTHWMPQEPFPKPPTVDAAISAREGE